MTDGIIVYRNARDDCRHSWCPVVNDPEKRLLIGIACSSCGAEVHDGERLPEDAW